MKARGVYVYGVWCPECGWAKVFHPEASFAEEHKNEMRKLNGCPKTIKVNRVYIAPPRGSKK